MARAAPTSSPALDAKLDQARAHEAAGRVGKAEALYRQILRKNGRHPGALQALAVIARRAGHAARAVQLLSRAVDAAPDDAALRCDVGNALKALGRTDEALDHHRRMVALLPNSPEALSNLGTTCAKAGLCDEAFVHLERATALDPGNAELHHNLGNGLIAAGRFEDAAEAFQRAVSISPNHVRARTNLGVACKELGRLEDAMRHFAAALEVAPGDVDAGWNLGLARLMAGDWRAGWEAYEGRRRIPGFAMRRLDRPAWDGAPLAGRSLLVHAEQGLGDTVQFARYLALLDGADGEVFFWCQDALAPLLSRQAGTVGSVSDPPPRTDLHAPLLSLPHLLGVAPPLVPEPAAYLRAEPERVERWSALLDRGALNVGIAWQGRPDYAADARRSIPLRHFAPIAARRNARLASLQLGHGAEQLGTVDWRDRIREFGPDFDGDGAFRDSAAVIAGLDLVITSDSAIAHLAGALGATVWLALAHVPDWRWGLRGETTPWYPTMRLFRQDRPGDWDGVFDRITAALGAYSAGGASPPR